MHTSWLESGFRIKARYAGMVGWPLWIIPWGVKIKWPLTHFFQYFSEKSSKNHENYFFSKFITWAFFWMFFHIFWIIFDDFVTFWKKVLFLHWDSFSNHLYSSTFGIVLDWLYSDEFRYIDMNLKQCIMIRTHINITLVVFLRCVRIISTRKSKRGVFTTSRSAFKIPNVSSGWFLDLVVSGTESEPYVTSDTSNNALKGTWLLT